MAAKHYLQVRDTDFEKALTLSEGGAQSGALSADKEAQNQAQPISANPSRCFQEKHKALENQGLWLKSAKDGESWQTRKVTPTGSEQSMGLPGKTQAARQNSAENSALCSDSAPIDPDLAYIVNQWPSLPETIRRRLVELVQRHFPKASSQ